MLSYALPLAAPVLAALFLLFCKAALRRRWALIALLSFVATFPNISFRIRDEGHVGLDWQNGAKVLIWAALFAICVFNWRRITRRMADAPTAFLLAYAVFGMLSAAYSQIPAYSLATAFGMLTYFAFPCLLAAELDESTLIKTIVYSLAVFLIVNLAAVIVIPDIAVLPPSLEEAHYRLQGVTGQPNSLGQEAATFICATLVGWRCRYLRRTSCLILVALGAACLIASDSRTSAFAVVVSWALIGLRTRRITVLWALVAGSALAVVVAFAGATGLLPSPAELLGYFSRSGNEEELVTMSGRTDIWAVVLDRIADRPILGYGFNTAEVVLTNDWRASTLASSMNAHNMYLQSLLTVGIVGTAPLIAAIGVLVHRFVTRPSVIRDQFTLFWLVTAMSEAEVVSTPVLATLALGCALASASARRPEGVAPGFGSFQPFAYNVRHHARTHVERGPAAYESRGRQVGFFRQGGGLSDAGRRRPIG